MSVTVHQALAAVMAELPNIGKADKSPEGYVYRGIEAVTKHVQPLLAKHGVVIVPRATVTDVRPSPAMKEGWTDVYMTVEWSVVGPDGSVLVAQTTGIGRDRADKGANKAQTQAFKYLLLHLLCIADGKDDSDGQTYDEHRSERTEPRRPLGGWSTLEEQDAAHEDFRETVAASPDAVQQHLREFRSDRGFPWPMPKVALDDMWAQLVSAQASLGGEVEAGGGAPVPGEQRVSGAAPAPSSEEKRRARAEQVAGEAGTTVEEARALFERSEKMRERVGAGSGRDAKADAAGGDDG